MRALYFRGGTSAVHDVSFANNASINLRGKNRNASDARVLGANARSLLDLVGNNLALLGGGLNARFGQVPGSELKRS